jgi:hypothetical protein
MPLPVDVVYLPSKTILKRKPLRRKDVLFMSKDPWRDWHLVLSALRVWVVAMAHQAAQDDHAAEWPL